MAQSRILTACTGIALSLKAHQSIRITNTHGQQVVDFWALSAQSPPEYLSMSHTHAILRRIVPKAGDILFSNTSQPFLSFVQDTTKGHHDTLISACNPRRYKKLGVQGWHASCEENYRLAVERSGAVEIDSAPKAAPTPLNLFMNVSVDGEGALTFGKPTSEKGQHVVLKALVDLVVVLSACPMDQRASEEWVPKPMDVQYEILEEE